MTEALGDGVSPGAWESLAVTQGAEGCLPVPDGTVGRALQHVTARESEESLGRRKRFGFSNECTKGNPETRGGSHGLALRTG